MLYIKFSSTHPKKKYAEEPQSSTSKSTCSFSANSFFFEEYLIKTSDQNQQNSEKKVSLSKLVFQE